MNDPFTLLRVELEGAAGRLALPAPSGRRGWMPWSSRPLSIVLAAVVISGSAAAAAFSLAGSRSQPLTGKVPGAIQPASVGGYRYSIAVSPSLYTGSVGWESFIAYSTNSPLGRLNRNAAEGGGGGGGYPTVASPLFGGSVYSFGPSTTTRGQTVDYVLTSPQVVALRFGNRTIRTFSSRALPAGDRAAVFFVPAREPTLIPWHPGMRLGGVEEELGCPCRHGRAVSVVGKFRFLAILPLDRDGNAISTQVPPSSGPVPFFYWQAPSAVTPGNGESHYHGATRPHPGACELAQHGLPGLVGEWGGTISKISPVQDALGEVFLSCVNTEYYLQGWPLDVAVLLDARHPGEVLGPIPGARTLPGHPQMVDLAARQVAEPLTAKRVGNAWLVAEGGSGLAQRITVLNALRISKLDLPNIGSQATTP